MAGGSFGKLLSEVQRKELANLNFKHGAILKFYCYVAKKEKRFIYIGQKFDYQSIALVHINSEINENVFPSAKLKAEHYKLFLTDYQTLDHDSFVNCSQLIVRTKTEIYQLLVNDPGCHLEHISEVHLNEIRMQVCKSRVLSPANKKEYGLFLNCKP